MQIGVRNVVKIIISIDKPSIPTVTKLLTPQIHSKFDKNWKLGYVVSKKAVNKTESKKIRSDQKREKFKIKFIVLFVKTSRSTPMSGKIMSGKSILNCFF